MKKLVKCMGLVLCMTMLVLSSTASQATNMSNITSSTIKDMEQQIENAENEMNNLKNSLSNAQSLVKELEKEKSNLTNYVTKLDNTLALLETKISDLNSQITQKETDISVTQEQLAQAKEVEAGQYAAMNSRIKYVYEKGTSGYVEMLLQSQSPADLLNRMIYVEAITSYDKERLDEYIANKEYIALCEAQLQTEKEYLDAMKLCVENEQAAVETLIATKTQEIENYENSITSKEQAIEEYEAELAEQTEIIQQLEKAIEDEKKKILMSNGKVIIYDGGTFAFPLESYTRISSEYGYRIHPILNVKQFHNGVDFAAPKGTKIYAAYDGIVVAATYSSTMGNYVMIDHGGGLYTIYMHASKLYVAKDDVVVKGEHIAAVGSTGRSTGNHLHFTVRKDGAYVSPWDYLSE